MGGAVRAPPVARGTMRRCLCSVGSARFYIAPSAKRVVCLVSISRRGLFSRGNTIRPTEGYRSHYARERLVAARGDLPSLSTIVPGLEWGWCRRPQGDCAAIGAPGGPRNRRDLDLADLSFADAGFWVRRQRILRCAPYLWLARRLRCPSRTRARTRRQGHP